ncbi:MAG: glutamate racemase [Clostridia bacterium]|nr:glutamate racemase [Clostridia bacterium]
MKIGFYDSGLGGIKTLKDIIDMGLKEEIYFLADEKNKPYGTKTPDEVKKIAFENVKRLVDLGCKIVVVACNTATSVAIQDLREKFPKIEIIGTEPAVKLAVKEHTNKKILVIATTVTVHGEKLHKLINSLDVEEKIELLATDKLVKLVEDENFTHNQKEVNQYICEFLEPYNLEEYSHIILGCTHFPIVKQNIQDIVNDYGIKVIDGNVGIGRNLLNKISEYKMANIKRKDESKLEIRIINTAPSKVFEKRTKEILQEISSENILFLEKIS